MNNTNILMLRSESLLRDYQQDAISKTLDWLEKNPHKNPCINLPTGSGKSWVIAALIEFAMKKFPEGRALVVTHTKELVAQDYDKMLKVWEDAPAGIYCTGLKRKDRDCRITFASIGSIYRHPELFKDVGLLIIDEAHRIDMSGKAIMYHALIKALREYVPNMIVIGLTATPYRTGQGYLTDGDDALFDAVLKGADIKELVEQGYLAPLRSKATDMHLDLSKVRTVKGDYEKHELSKVVNTDENNAYVADLSIQTIKKNNCQHGLIFCCSIEHACALAETFQRYGMKDVAALHGQLSYEERDRIIDDFKSGKLRVLTNVNILTTGFDFPDIDFIALCRPTQSANLYVQMVGRGMRPKSKDVNQYCLVMDFGECVQRFGPITDLDDEVIRKPKTTGKAPTKKCPNCFEICATADRRCPVCGFEFHIEGAKQAPKDLDPDADIMGGNPRRGKVLYEVRRWRWEAKTSQKGDPQIVVRFYPKGTGRLSPDPVKKFFPLCNPSANARAFARQNLCELARDAGGLLYQELATMRFDSMQSLREVCKYMQGLDVPRKIEATYKGDSSFPSYIRILE